MLKLIAVTAAAVVLAATGLLPQQIGGSVSYVITDGISMLPTLHAGELVILRKEPQYHVGEVAAYHNRQLKVIVLHRIVAIEHGHYLFKGDNNHFTTTYEPTKGEIVGGEWFVVPDVGSYLVDLRAPVVAAIVLGLLWLISFAPRSRSRRQRRRRRHGA